MVARILSESTEDVISFCHQHPNYLAWTDKIHPGFLELFVPLCMELGIKVKEPKCTVYASQFVAKHQVYADYRNLCLVPAMDLLESDKYKGVWKDSTYRGLPPQILKALTGLGYYPMHTFVLERLMSVWIDHQGLSFKVVK